MMNKFKHITLLAALIPFQGYSQTSIDECIRMAYANYPQIEEYDLIEASKQYDLKNSSLAWAPQFSISGKASWQSDVVEMPADIPGFEFNIPHDQYGATIDMTQQIWDGGKGAAEKNLINAGAEVKSKQLKVSLYSIRSRVQNIYLAIILIDKQLELNEVLRTNLIRNLGEVDALLNGGVALLSDKDQIKVNILACEQQRTGLETDRRAYVKMLSLLTGMQLEGKKLLEPSVDLHPDFSAEISRPELELYDAQSRQINFQKDQLKVALMPRFNLNIQGGYGRPGLNMLSGEFRPYLTAGIKMQWNFGALYTIRNDRKKADADFMKVELNTKSFKLNTSIEAAEKQGEIDKAADVLSRDGEIIKLRQSIRETGETQYKEGVIKMNDYLSLLDEEFKAKLNFNLHTLQYLLACYDLENTLGTHNQQ